MSQYPTGAVPAPPRTLPWAMAAGDRSGPDRPDRPERPSPPPAPAPAPPGSPADLDLSAYARHRLWLNRPTVRLTIDFEQDQMLLSFYPGAPDREIDPTLELSTGFHGPAGDVLLTSLCLLGLGRWAGNPVEDDVWLTRELLGPTVRETIDELLSVKPLRGAAHTTELLLEQDEARILAATWSQFVLRPPSGPRPADA